MLPFFALIAVFGLFLTLVVTAMETMGNSLPVVPAFRSALEGLGWFLLAVGLALSWIHV